VGSHRGGDSAGGAVGMFPGHEPEQGAPQGVDVDAPVRGKYELLGYMYLWGPDGGLRSSV